MQTLATHIVPPMIEAQIYGVSRAQISARKVKLFDLNDKQTAVAPRSVIGTAELAFGDLVQRVRNTVQAARPSSREVGHV